MQINTNAKRQCTHRHSIQKPVKFSEVQCILREAILFTFSQTCSISVCLTYFSLRWQFPTFLRMTLDSPQRESMTLLLHLAVGCT